MASISQSAPSSPGSSVFVHPWTVSQASVVHPSASSHSSGVPARHVPLAGSQASTPLQASPSLQPSASGVGAARHAPLTHSPAPVQALPSSHGPVSSVYWQPATVSQTSLVHGLASSQANGVASHAPVVVLHCSMPSHTSPSPALQASAAAERMPTHFPPTQL